jgi:hypothetical protein
MDQWFATVTVDATQVSTSSLFDTAADAWRWAAGLIGADPETFGMDFLTDEAWWPDPDDPSTAGEGGVSRQREYFVNVTRVSDAERCPTCGHITATPVLPQ